MAKSQLEYLNKFFPDDQMEDLIRIKNEINLLGEDDLLSQLHIIDEAGYLFRRDELETFIKNINFK